MIIKQLSKMDFVNEFETSSERKTQFTFNALTALYDYLDEYRDLMSVTAYTFDMIGICCDFTEYDTIEEAAKEYSITPIELEDNTTVLHVLENGHVVVQNY